MFSEKKVEEETDSLSVEKPIVPKCHQMPNHCGGGGGGEKIRQIVRLACSHRTIILYHNNNFQIDS